MNTLVLRNKGVIGEAHICKGFVNLHIIARQPSLLSLALGLLCVSVPPCLICAYPVRRWEAEKGGPQFLFVSPGLHDCYHAPEEYEHHTAELRRLARHLAALQPRQTIVWIDANPITYAAHKAAALKCMFYVNAAAHALAREFGLLMFSRQTMIVSGHQVGELHQLHSISRHQPRAANEDVANVNRSCDLWCDM